MKYYLCLIFLFVFSVSMGQNAIVGNWKIVSVTAEELYYDFRKDSISLPEEYQEVYRDSARLAQAKFGMRMLFGGTKFSFEESGNYKWEFMPEAITTGKYSVDEKKQVIKLTDFNSVGEETVDDVSYKLTNGYLEIEIDFSDRPGKYILERI